MKRLDIDWIDFAFVTVIVLLVLSATLQVTALVLRAMSHQHCVASHTEWSVTMIPTGNNNMPLQTVMLPTEQCDKWH